MLRDLTVGIASSMIRRDHAMLMLGEWGRRYRCAIPNEWHTIHLNEILHIVLNLYCYVYTSKINESFGAHLEYHPVIFLAHLEQLCHLQNFV